MSAEEAWARAVSLRRAGRAGEGEALLRARLTARPADAQAARALAQWAMETGQAALAASTARTAVRLAPEAVEGHALAGAALLMLGEHAEAVAHLERVPPGHAMHETATANLAVAYQKVNRCADAERCFRVSLARRPEAHHRACALAGLLAEVGRGSEAVALLRERAGAGVAGAGVGGVGAGVSVGASAPVNVLGTLAYTSNLDDGMGREERLAIHRSYGRAEETAQRAADPSWRMPPARAAALAGLERRALRVGLLSPDLREHSVAYFVEPLLRGADAGRMRVVAYHADASPPDRVTRRLRALAQGLAPGAEGPQRPAAPGWREVAGLDPAALRRTIDADGLDVLIDLAGLTNRSRAGTMALRCAPVQATMIGYPNTTGLSAIDVRLVDALTDPRTGDDGGGSGSGGDDDAQRFATERLLRLDDGLAPGAGPFLGYQPPGGADDEAAPAVEGVPPSQRLGAGGGGASGGSGAITFGSFNNFAKVSPTTLRLWGRVLSAVPGARLLIKSKRLEDPSVRAYVQRLLERAGVNPSRLELAPHTRDRAGHLACYHRVDIALDTFPYHGTTTTCEALWMGVPVVTLAGSGPQRTHAARVGASLLAAAQRGCPEPLDDLVAPDEASYVRTAAALAGDGDRLRRLRGVLREAVRAGPLGDARGYAARVEAALRGACGVALA